MRTGRGGPARGEEGDPPGPLFGDDHGPAPLIDRQPVAVFDPGDLRLRDFFAVRAEDPHFAFVVGVEAAGPRVDGDRGRVALVEAGGGGEAGREARFDLPVLGAEDQRRDGEEDPHRERREHPEHRRPRPPVRVGEGPTGFGDTVAD